MADVRTMRRQLKALYSEAFAKRLETMTDKQVYAIWMRVFGPKDKN